MTMPTRTQQNFYNALMQADRQQIETVREFFQAWEAWRTGARPSVPRPEEFGIRSGSPPWAAIESAGEKFRDEILGGGYDPDRRITTEAVLRVVRAVLAAKGV